MNNPIFEDRESLIKILSDERRSGEFMAGLMWENVKYFSTLISALITADIFLLRFFLEDIELPSQQYTTGIAFLSLILPILIMAISILGERELKRRWMRVLESVAYAGKIESLLGLDQKLASASGRVFPKDEYLFQQRWMESRMKYQSSREFIEGELKGYNMYTHMRKIYFITCLTGMFLIIIHMFLFFVR